MKPMDRRNRTIASIVGVLIVVSLFPIAPAGANGWAHNSIPFDALVEGLKAEDAGTRAQSAQYLGLRAWPGAKEPLIAVVEGPEEDPTVRSAAYVALGRLHDESVLPVLERCLTSETRPELRADCLIAMGELGVPAALDHVLAAFAEDPSILVRSRAVDVLGSFIDRRSVDALSAVVLASDRNPTLRRRAIQSLGRTGELAAGDALLQALEAPADEAERLSIVAALGQVKAAAAAGPLQELLRQTAEPVLRAQIVVALGAIRDGSSRPTLVEMLEDPVPAVRYLAVESLHAMGARDAAAPIDALGRELTGQVRDGAADWPAHAAALVVQARTLVAVLRALIDLDPAKGEATMLEAAKLPTVDAPAAAALAVETALFECRRVALHGLGYVPSAAAAELLQGPQGLGHADYRMRATAARSLAVQGGPDALARLLPSLADPSSEVRWTAALGLGRLADRRAVPPLLERLSDGSARVRREASLALGYLGDPAAKPGLQSVAAKDDAEAVRAAAAYALQLIDRPAP